MDTFNGAEATVRMLDLYGVRHIFGLCGDTSLPLYDALYRLDHRITHVLTRDERSAAYMADGYARVSGRPGVCEGPSGGGATYLLPGLVEANESSSPVLGITSDVPVLARGRYPLTELDQESLYRPLTKWNTVCDRADQVPQAIRTAFRYMTTGRPGAAHIGLPYDVLKQPVNPGEVWVQAGHDRYPAWRSGADPSAVEAAAAAILQARRPLFICGGGVIASRATTVLAQVATLLNAPVCTTVSGKGSIADTHPLGVGVVGLNGGVVATRAVVEQADLVIFIGCRAGSTTTERGAQPSRAVTIVHIDVDPTAVSANYDTAHALIGDARLVLHALLDALHRQLPTRTARRVRWRGGRGTSAPGQARGVPAPCRIERAADPARTRAGRAQSGPAARRHRRRRPWNPVPVCVGVLRAARDRPSLHHQPRARRARLFDGGRGRRVVRAAAEPVRLDHG